MKKPSLLQAEKDALTHVRGEHAGAFLLDVVKYAMKPPSEICRAAGMVHLPDEIIPLDDQFEIAIKLKIAEDVDWTEGGWVLKPDSIAAAFHLKQDFPGMALIGGDFLEHVVRHVKQRGEDLDPVPGQMIQGQGRIHPHGMDRIDRIVWHFDLSDPSQVFPEKRL